MRHSPLIPALVAACSLVLAVASSAGSTDRATGSTAHAWAVRVIVPGQPGASTRVLSAPPDAVTFDGAFAYPADASVVSVGSVTTSVNATNGQQARAGATAQATALSIFQGEIVASAVTGETHAAAGPASASGDTGVTGLNGLVVLGQPVTPTANQQIPLADWGHAVALEQKGQLVNSPTPGYHETVVALDVFITSDHGGLPAGSEIQIGYSDTSAQASVAAPPPVSTTAPTTTGRRPHAPKPPPGPPASKPLTVTPKLGENGYVFPVYGRSSYGDSYGAFRGDVSGDWHHGDDIFAALGTPVLAIAHGTVFSVGWEKLGGWRLWLRDDKGNEFYYAHLSAYSPLAVNGAIVSAGDVLGFVGNTGDAKGTPYHLHFEVHPVGLLGLGYDGAVDPTTYLDGWTHVKDVRFEAAVGWSPQLAGAAPKAGAVLLESSDISSASGLDPGSLRRAFEPASGHGEGGLSPPSH